MQHSLSGGSFTITHFEETGGCGFKWHGKNALTQIHPIILSYFESNWDAVVGNEHSELHCRTDFHHRNGIDTSRCHPDYSSEGAWYDWAMVRFTASSRGPDMDSLAEFSAFSQCPTPINYMLSSTLVITRITKVTRNIELEK